MLRAKRQLSQGSVDDDCPPIQRRRSSMTQAGTDRRGENDDSAVRIRNQWTQNNRHYDQSSSNAPIFNAPIYGGVHNNTQISTLDGLQFLYHHAAMGAIHGSEEGTKRPRCHPGTREVVVRRIIGWHLDKDGRKKIMWVHAPAGYGKTAVAGTVKDELDVMELGFDTPVGATFFFWRDSLERNSPTRFIVTLAYQLAESIPELGPRVEAAIKFKPGIVKMALELQLIKLIVEPFQSLSSYSNMPTRLVIIDGIDECINSGLESRVEKKYAEDQEHVQRRVLDLIHCLHSHHLPLSFLILSRPEAWIVRHLGSSSFCDVVEPLDLSEVGDLMDDVQRFVRAELSRIAKEYNLEGAGEEWPGEWELICRSQGNMLYASTVIRHIDDPYGDPRHLLKEILDSSTTTNPAILDSSPFSTLYELYRQIMRSCPERNRRLMIEVLEDAMCMYARPFGFTVEATFRILDGLSGRSPDSSLKALRPLHSLLRVGLQHKNRKIYDLFIHSTFMEFLRKPHLSFDFVVDTIGGAERQFSYSLNCLAGVTTETIGNKPGEVTEFALACWCHIWFQLKPRLRSKTFYLRMMKKVIALDTTACIIQGYHILPPSGTTSPTTWGYQSPLFCALYTPTCFFDPPEYIDACECADTLSIADKVTAHWRSSLDNAFTSLLHATGLPSSIPLAATSIGAQDCSHYLEEVIAEVNWREHKLVQALGTPGPGGIALFKAILKNLLDGSDGQDWRWELLGHLYEVMVQEQNPILEEEDHPFRRFLDFDFGTAESESDFQSVSESESDFQELLD